MARPNDVIWLRFYRDDRECPPLETEAFHNLVQALKQQVIAVASAFQVEIGGVTLSIAAPPRQGCLEIPLVLGVLNDPSVGTVLSTVAQVGIDAFKAFEEHIDTVTFLATLLFGGHSVMDLWAKRGQKDFAAPPERQILFQLSRYAIQNDAVVQGAIQLARAAAACDMHRVEIQVRDEPAVSLFSGENRARAGLIGSRPAAPVDLMVVGELDPAGRQRVYFKLNELECLQVVWNGVQYPAYRAFSFNPNRALLLIWAAKKAQPTAWENAEATGIYIDPRDVMPLDVVPEAFETIDGAFVVQGVIRIED